MGGEWGAGMIDVTQSQNGSIILSNAVGTALVVPASELQGLVARLSEMVSPATVPATTDLFGEGCTVSLADEVERTMKVAFDRWWKTYPRKAGKLKAEKTFYSVVKKRLATIDELIAGAARYAQSRIGEDSGFTMHPTTWLNGGHWGDEPEVARRYTPATKAETAADGISMALEAFKRREREQQHRQNGLPQIDYNND